MSIKLNIQSDAVEIAKADELVVVERDTSTREIFLHLQLRDTGNVLVCEDSKLVGIFTERDAIKLLVEDANLDVPISDVMITNPMTIPQGTPIAEAIRIMAAGGYRRLPIIDADGQPVGIIKVSGILAYLVDHFPEAIFNLPPEPNVVMPEREGA